MKKNIKRILKKFKKKNTHKFSGKLKNLFNNNKFSNDVFKKFALSSKFK